MTEPAYPFEQSWPAAGEWTYADYLRLPDDGRRYEVIRSNLYVSPAPRFEHQLAVVRLSRFLDVYVSENDLGLILVAPFDILLPQQIAEPVQPDVIFFKKGNEPRVGDTHFSGVPDLLVEVLSPSTRRLDEKVKLAAYRDAGVPELWFADPKPQTLRVLRLDKGVRTYVEEAFHGPGETVGSPTFPGLQIEIREIFPRHR
jgi:Uma2 family endonuclease